MIYAHDIQTLNYTGDALHEWGGNSAKLNRFNHLKEGHPVTLCRTRFTPLDGWRCLGAASPPFKGCAPFAIVYEHIETGELWWGHGSKFLPVKC